VDQAEYAESDWRQGMQEALDASPAAESEG
jgi:hypothetical protein